MVDLGVQVVQWVAARFLVRRNEDGLVTIEYLKWIIGLAIGLPVIIALILAGLNAFGVDVNSSLK